MAFDLKEELLGQQRRINERAEKIAREFAGEYEREALKDAIVQAIQASRGDLIMFLGRRATIEGESNGGMF